MTGRCQIKIPKGFIHPEQPNLSSIEPARAPSTAQGGYLALTLILYCNDTGLAVEQDLKVMFRIDSLNALQPLGTWHLAPRDATPSLSQEFTRLFKNA